MIILPDRNICRTKLLLPVGKHEWQVPSQAQPKDQFGNENRTKFRVRARLNDGFVKWCGWFNDRDDFDAFLWAIAQGNLKQQPELWRLPAPWWDPFFDEGVTYDFATVTFLTTTGSNQTYTSPSDWNNGNNTIECVGGGASGGAAENTNHVTGGGGGVYAKISNFSFAAPGTTTATYRIGALAAAIVSSSGPVAGNNGNPSWFNNASDPGTGSDNSKCGAKGGTQGVGGTGSQNGGAGGATATSWGQTLFAGGRGGNLTGASGSGGSGGGGAAGPSGAGGAGGDSSSTSTNVTTAGGTGNNGTDAGGGAGNNNGASGTEWDGSHGLGGGGGGNAAIGNATSGSGGTYGGGGGGSKAGFSSTGTSGEGRQGIIVVTYTPPPIGKLFQTNFTVKRASFW